MLKVALRKMRYAALLLKIGGPKVFYHQLRRQLYSRDILFGLEKDLDSDSLPVPCKVEYTLRQASEEDMEEAVSKAKSESKGSVHELVERKWFYESGFRNCYVARSADTGELCHIQWLVTKDDDDVINGGFGNRLPRLKAGEILLENTYTFEKYRGNSISPSVVVELCKLAGSRGFKRILAYIRQGNIAALRSFERVGFKKFEQIPESKLLFYTRRKHN